MSQQPQLVIIAKDGVMSCIPLRDPVARSSVSLAPLFLCVTWSDVVAHVWRRVMLSLSSRVCARTLAPLLSLWSVDIEGMLMALQEEPSLWRKFSVMYDRRSSSTRDGSGRGVDRAQGDGGKSSGSESHDTGRGKGVYEWNE